MLLPLLIMQLVMSLYNIAKTLRASNTQELLSNYAFLMQECLSIITLIGAICPEYEKNGKTNAKVVRE